MRVNFSSFRASVSPKSLRRMFCMPIECFNLLCCRIENSVGMDKFMSEEHLDTYLLHDTKKSSTMYKAHKEGVGGYICGEIKVAIALRLLPTRTY